MSDQHTKRSRTKVWSFFWGLIVGAALSWALFVFLYSPTDAQFLRTAHAQYFKELSTSELSQHGAFGDCRLVDPDQQDKRMGIKKIAICELATPDGERRSLVIAMTPTANILYTDTETFLDQSE